MKFNYILTTILIVLLTACTDNFEEINSDPNRPGTITPGVILGQLQYRLVNSSMTASKNFTHELMQVDAPRSSTNGAGLHRYVVNPGSGVWSNFYLYMNDIEDLYSMADALGENNYKAIALVYKSWAYSIVSDLYGDIPYTQATKATEGVYQAAFDRQSDIYPALLQNLEMANQLFDDSKALTYGGDMVYNANALTGNRNTGIVKWRKFANSLRLRLLLRAYDRDREINVTEQINTMLSDPSTYPLMSTIADGAVFRYPGTYPYYNPYYNARTIDWRQGNYFTKFFLATLMQTNDPRLAVWATQVNVDGQMVYQGIESGYPPSTEYIVDKNSSYQDALKTLPQLGVMMTHAEVEFILAELALKQFATPNTAKMHYQFGIASSITQWGAAVPSDFFTRDGIAYDEAGTEDEQLQQIMLQKYYAYFFVDYQSWFEKRRTGFPVLPRGDGIPPENNFPSRVPYPTYLQSLNAAELARAVDMMGGDDSDGKVWWDKE